MGCTEVVTTGSWNGTTEKGSADNSVDRADGVFYCGVTKTTLPHYKSKPTDPAQLTKLIYQICILCFT